MGCRRVREGGTREGRNFFFEKRSKKLFNALRGGSGSERRCERSGASASSTYKCLRRSSSGSVSETGIAQRRGKFFGSFFQKRTFFLLLFFDESGSKKSI
jgi:hypothetical protein